MAIEDSLTVIESAVADIRIEIGAQQEAAAPAAPAEVEAPAEDATETVEEPAAAGGPNAPFVPAPEATTDATTETTTETPAPEAPSTEGL